MKSLFKDKQNTGVYQSAPTLSQRNAIELHLGTNSLMVLLALGTSIYIASTRNVLDPSYLKGLDDDVLFVSGFLSFVFGVSCYEFWNLGKRSIYSFHLMLSRSLTSEMTQLFTFRDYSFALGSNKIFYQLEFPPLFRQLACIAIAFLLALVTIDNRAFNKLKSLPDNLFAANQDFCPEEPLDGLGMIEPEPGCELVMRAFELGYTKDLGSCAPKKIAPEQLQICEKRRVGEPYLHYASRLLFESGNKLAGFFSKGELNKIEKKFQLQWQQVEALRDYQLYAMSAAPRASHHIWTNLPSPKSKYRQAFVDIFQPNYCLERFQNQTNTVALDINDERRQGKMLEHVYGQLLFNPKVKRTVGLCKEYQIHWQADENVCDRLAETPRQVLAEYQVLPEVELVLKRHDIAKSISLLDEQLEQLETAEMVQQANVTSVDAEGAAERKSSAANAPIDKSKIAKNKRFREKHEIVSFHCFMNTETDGSKQHEKTFTLKDSEFTVRSYEFNASKGLGESQIAMYKDFAKTLDAQFYYSQLSSRSDIALQQKKTGDASENSGSGTSKEGIDQGKYLQNEQYLLARLEMLNNIDIFLGNDWVLERDDLLEVYPFHVHLQNYVESFRVEYQQSTGRL